MAPELNPAWPSVKRMNEIGEKEEESATSSLGHSLYQDLFFFCTVKNVGDLPGTGCIYVETVVDSDSGVAFAKVYPAKNALNAADILASRVLPFYERQGVPIKEVYTPESGQYFGLLPVHPFETFLSTSHIQHLPMHRRDHPHFYLCEQFYAFLLREFFQPALRKKFQLSLDELQRDLDTFVEAYNAMRLTRGDHLNSKFPPPPNFPVDV